MDDAEERFAEIERKTICIEQEVAGLTRLITIMGKTIANHDDVLQKNGISDLRTYVAELRLLLYGEPRVGAPGLLAQIKTEQERTNQLVAQRDMIKWVLVGVSVATVGQTTLLISIANKVFGVP